MSNLARALPILVRREAWEYRAWWTHVLWAVLALVALGMIGIELQSPTREPGALAFQDAFFLRWNHALFLGGTGLMALAHAAHAVFDERQDRSIGFWQSFPIPERSRLLAKSMAITLGWPLLAAAADTALCLFALAKALVIGRLFPAWEQILPVWQEMMNGCLLTAAWSWPLVCGWLLCSAVAPRTPWAWGWLAAAMTYFVAASVGMDPWPVAAAIALGPLLPAIASVSGEVSRLPWDVGSVAWFASYLAGWGALNLAATRVGDAAEG